MAKSNYYLGNKNLPTPTTTYQYSDYELQEIQRCQNNIEYFANKYVYIISLDEGKRLIKLHDYQKRVLKAFHKFNRVAVCASRQSGKTTCIMIYALWYMCFEEHKRILLVANKEKTAIGILKRVRTAYEMLPNWLKPGVTEYGKTEIFLANGSSLSCSTTTETAGRSESANILLIDEAAFISPASVEEEFFKSTFPIITASKKSKIILLSTPNGTSNKFYEFFSGAEAGTNTEWHPERIDWWEVPEHDEDWKQRQIQTLGSEEAFNQEYGNKFIQEGQSLLDEQIIKMLKDTIKKPELHIKDGCYKIWEPPNPNKIYSIGVDVSEGIGQANSSISIFNITDIKNITQSAQYTCNYIDPYNFAGELNEIANQWGAPPLLIERNSCGGQVLDALFYTHQYNNIVNYGATTENDRRLGIYSHTNTKAQGVLNMRYWLNIKKCVKIYDKELYFELTNFIRFPNGTWKAQSEKHKDDRVMSLIWCLMILHEKICPVVYEVELWDKCGKPDKIKNINFEPITDKRYMLPDIAAPVSDNAMPVFFGGPVENNKQELDINELMENGWNFLQPQNK